MRGSVAAQACTLASEEKSLTSERTHGSNATEFASARTDGSSDATDHSALVVRGRRKKPAPSTEVVVNAATAAPKK